MSTPTLIGGPSLGSAYTARRLHYGEDPDILVPRLRRMSRDTFAADTQAMLDRLLGNDWSSLDPAPRPTGRQQPVPGIGYPAPTSEPAPRRGRLTEDLDGFLEWLYLLHVEQRAVVVYEATCHGRWLRHSYRHLDPVEDVFVIEPDPATGGITVCSVCGAVDEVEHQELPSMLGYGTDTSTACTRCGSSVCTDPMFGAHINRKSWPPVEPDAVR